MQAVEGARAPFFVVAEHWQAGRKDLGEPHEGLPSRAAAPPAACGGLDRCGYNTTRYRVPPKYTYQLPCSQAPPVPSAKGETSTGAAPGRPR